MTNIYSGTDATRAYEEATKAEANGHKVQIDKMKMGRGVKSWMVYHVYIH